MEKDELYLAHIVEAIGKIGKYAEGITRSELEINSLVQDAIVRELEIIGEAARHISEETRKSFPGVPWTDVSAMRNKLIHEYFGVDFDIVWRTVIEDLPRLLKELRPHE